MANRPALHEEINAVFKTLPRDEVVARLKAGNIAYGAVNSVADLSNHPQLDRVVVESPEGPVSMPASPIHLEGLQQTFGPIPALGEHNEKIRNEFSN